MTRLEIKAIRKHLGITSAELAKLIGAKPNTVRSWECGARLCKGIAAESIRRLATERPFRTTQ